MSDNLLETTTKVKYLEHMELMGFKEGVHWWFEQKKSIIRFINGSTIRFKTMSDWRQFMSSEYTWIEMEEASFIDETTFKKLMSRLREYKRPEWKDYYRCMFLHTNPQGRRGWIYKYFINKNTKIPGYRCVVASTRENHHLGDSYIELLEDLYDADEVAEMIEGLDNDEDNTVAFPRFTDQNILENIEINRSYPVILSCDFNYNPMCWFLMQEIEGKWYVLKEFIENNVTTKEMCQRIQPVLNKLNIKKMDIMGDSHGRDKKTNGSDYSVMLTHFSEHGIDCTLRVQRSNPRIKERLSVLRGTIKNAKGVVSFFVDSACTRLIYNFEECRNNLSNGALREPTSKEIESDIKKLYLIHPIDAISYPIHFKRSLNDIGAGT